MSEFAEYVEQQQSIRYPKGPTARASTSKKPQTTEQHEELDDLFLHLELADSAPRIPLKNLLLATDDDSLQKLEDLVADRTEEGWGECIFELGHEINGDSMLLSPAEWTTAYDRLVHAAKKIHTDCELLITNYVGGDKEATSTATTTSKDKGCSGKILIRQIPASIDKVIETRIAVVGNGTYIPIFININTS